MPRMIILILLLNLYTAESKVAMGKAKRLHSSLGYLGRSKLQVRLSTLNKDVRWKSLCNKMCHARGLIPSTCMEMEFAFDSGQTVKEVETSGLNTRWTRLSVVRMLLSIYSFFLFTASMSDQLIETQSTVRNHFQHLVLTSSFTVQSQRKQDLFQVKQAEIK